MPREKSRYRDRRSSSPSSESSYERKKKSRHKRRSRSRDRSESSSYKRKRSTSRTKHRRRSYSRSVSRDRYEKSRRRSSSRSRRDRSHSRSASRSKSKYTKSSKHKKSRRRSPSSRSSSSEERPVTSRVNLDDTDIKLEKAIKAAEAAGLTMTKLPTYEYKEVDIKEDMPTIHDRNLLAELNSDSFVQKTFTSSTKKRDKSIIIDLNNQTITMPEPEMKEDDNTIIDLAEIPDEEELIEMWIRKLYQYRKKMLKGEL